MRGWQTTTRRGKTVYQVRFKWTDKEGREHLYRRDAKRQTAKGAEAEFQQLWALYLRTGSPLPEPAPRAVKSPTWGEFMTTYVEPVYFKLLNVTPATLEGYRSIWRVIAPAFADQRISDFKVADWEAFEVTLRERKHKRKGRIVTGVSTRRFVIWWFGTLMRAAVRAGHLKEVPKYKRPPKPEILPDCPTRDEVAKMLEGRRTWVVVLAAILAYSGMRLSEARGLTRADVDLDAGRIWIRRSISAEKVSLTKSKKQRWVAIHPALAAILKPWIANKLPGASVIVNGRGKTPRRQHCLTAHLRHLARIGVKPWPLHALRHYVASELIEAGVPVRTVQAVVGHSQLATTMRYVHVRDGAIDAAIAKLPGPR